MGSPYNANLIARNGFRLNSSGRSKVAIIAANSTFREAPFNNMDWEVWGCNSLWKFHQDQHRLFRADRWFELHPMRVQTDDEKEAIKLCPIPIYTLQDESAWAPNSVRFPLDDVLKLNSGMRYFTCTFAYQIALAILEGFTTIGLYGVELDQGTARERTVEKACVDYWVGFANGRGIDVCLPEQSSIAYQPFLYGYEYREEVEAVNAQTTALFSVRLEELEKTGEVTYIPFEELNREQYPELEGNA